MHYSSNCGCGCNYDCGCNTVPSTCCSTTNNITTTTTTPCIGEPCDELYNADCILYKGPNISCYGLKTNDSLSDIINIIASNLTDCIDRNVCFTINYDGGDITESCLSIASSELWNGKPYYKIQINNCTNLIGFVYWNADYNLWIFSNQLGGTNIVYAILELPFSLPITSSSWIIIDTTYIILSSISGVCKPITTTTSTTTTTTTIPPTTTSTTIPPTTTTTTLPCICLSLYYNAGMSPSVSSFLYKDCDINGSSLSGSIAPNTRKNICTKGLINYDTSSVSVDNLGACSANCTSTTTTTRAPLPTPTTTSSTTSTTSTTSTSTTTSTTTTAAPVDCNCYKGIFTPDPGDTCRVSWIACDGQRWSQDGVNFPLTIYSYRSSPGVTYTGGNGAIAITNIVGTWC